MELIPFKITNSDIKITGMMEAADRGYAKHNQLTPLLDKNRHLICLPYSIENLHRMANEMGIKRCWYHPSRYPHYDIPKRRQSEMEARYGTIPTRDLWKIIKNAHQ